MLSEIITKSYFIDLSASPRWLVILGGTLLAGLVIWIAMKLLKVALWIFLIVVLVGGCAWAMFELLK